MRTRTGRREKGAAQPAAALPAFALYGDPGTAASDTLHVETIEARSSLYRWEIAHHVHQGLHQVVWLRSGSAELWLDSLHRQATGPLAVVVPPGTVHGFRFSDGSAGEVLTLSPRALVEGSGDEAGRAIDLLFSRARLMQPADAGQAARLAALFDALAAEFTAPGQAGSPVPAWLARALVWRLAQLAAHEDQAAGAGDAVAARGQQALFTRFLVLLEAHHAEHWPVARYAERLGLTAERLNTLARAETGRSTLALIHERLLREACRRVAYLAAPIARIGFELGFDDPAYFCRFFKRHTGVSPSAYRAGAAARGP